MFHFIKTALQKTYAAVTQKLSSLFAQRTIDQSSLEELKKILLSADAGPAVTNKIIAALTTTMGNQELSGAALQEVLHQELLTLLPTTHESPTPQVLLVVGVNGSGKTTFISKLAHQYVNQGKKPLLIAGDTFRAAAVDQLAAWGASMGVAVHIGKPQQDPASVIFDGCMLFARGGFDCLIIDTAGRLQTKINLMHELAKIDRTVTRCLPHATVARWLVLDSMLGQNCITQAHEFHNATKLTGIVLTKCDGTGKAGFIFAISDALHLPITYITFGEAPEALAPFNAERFVHDLIDAS